MYVSGEFFVEPIMNTKFVISGCAAAALALVLFVMFDDEAGKPGAHQITAPPAGKGLNNSPTKSTAGQPSSRPKTPAEGLSEEQVKALGELEEIIEDGEKSVDPILQPVREWAARDPAACADWIVKNLQGAARQRCLEEAIAIWAQKDPKQALAFLAGLGSPEGNEGAFANALSTLARQDAAAAAAWLQQHPSVAALENWQTLFSAWGETNPGQSLAWVQANLDQNMLEGLLPSLLTSFRDPAAQAQLLARSSPAKALEGLRDAAKATSFSDPIFALQIAGQIQTIPLRDSVTAEILRDWQARDATAANTYASQNGLTITATETTGQPVAP